MIKSNRTVVLRKRTEKTAGGMTHPTTLQATLVFQTLIDTRLDSTRDVVRYTHAYVEEDGTLIEVIEEGSCSPELAAEFIKEARQGSETGFTMVSDSEAK
jgi:hypothetical protein